MRARRAAIAACDHCASSWPWQRQQRALARCRARGRELVAIAAIVVLAGALRLWSLGARARATPSTTPPCAACRCRCTTSCSAPTSPGGTLAVDKPPLDLWLQVLSTQLLGFGSVALKLPPALAGTAAVAVLYDAVRRVLGTRRRRSPRRSRSRSLPIALLTARSDTMDSVAMLLSVVALWLLVRFAQDGRERWCYLAAAAMGLAFNVKLFEGLVALPALALFGAARLPRAAPRAPRGQRRRVRGRRAVVADDDAVLPRLGSAVRDRLDQRQRLERDVRLQRLRPHRRRRDAASAERAADAEPAASRQQQRARPLGGPDQRAGAAAPVRPRRSARRACGSASSCSRRCVLGVPALLWLDRSRPRGPDPRSSARSRVALLVWLAIGLVLYSAMARLHPRYTEGFTPAVAAAAGIGVAWALRDGLWQRLAGGRRARSRSPSTGATCSADRARAWRLHGDRRDRRRGGAAGPPRRVRACRCSPAVSRSRRWRCRSRSTPA